MQCGAASRWRIVCNVVVIPGGMHRIPTSNEAVCFRSGSELTQPTGSDLDSAAAVLFNPHMPTLASPMCYTRLSQSVTLRGKQPGVGMGWFVLPSLSCRVGGDGHDRRGTYDI